MRIKPSRTRRERITPAPLPQRRKRRNQPGARGRKIEPAPAKPDPDAVIDTIQWIAFAGIALAAVAMIALIWILIAGTVGDKTTQLRGRADQHVKSLAAVLAREIGDELAIVDQSLKIVQDAWARDSGAGNAGGPADSATKSQRGAGGIRNSVEGGAEAV